jgi:hypothetical protein
MTLLVSVSALLVSAVIAWGCVRIASAVQAATHESARARALEILAIFAPAAGAAAADPRAILAWQPLARTARQLFPDQFAELDRASGGTFPFGAERIQAAHAQWTADWLVWERAHDSEYKLKAAAAQEEMARSEGSTLARARADLIEREKLELYQRRYEEYVRVAKALQGLAG